MRHSVTRQSAVLIMMSCFMHCILTVHVEAGSVVRALHRFISRRKPEPDQTTINACVVIEEDSDECVNVVRDVGRAMYPYYYRGGYRDEVLQTNDATVAVATTIEQERIDVKAKAKKYRKYEFALFQKGDGSDEDPEGIPDRYLRMQLQRRELARKATLATLEWRVKHNIDTILRRPRPDFDIAKAVFPHYFVGRDVDGHVIFVQRPALLDLKLADKNGLNNKALLDHYVYVNEYLWQILEAKDALATMTSIIDLEGLSLSVLRQADLMSFMKEFVKTMDSHYPQRANKTLVVNAPKWFNLLYKIVSPLLRESTKKKIEIHSRGKQQDKVLKSRLGKKAETMLPESFFNKYSRKRKKNDHVEELLKPEQYEISDLERDLRVFTLARLGDAGQAIQQVELLIE